MTMKRILCLAMALMLALGVCALLAAGRPREARELFERAPGKKRMLRFVRRFVRQADGSERRRDHAVRQF